MSPRPDIAPLPGRYVDAAPFDPHRDEKLTPEQERFYTASQWRLMWWKFKRHKLAVVSAAVLLLFYASIVILEFLAPYDLHTRNSRFMTPRSGREVSRFSSTLTFAWMVSPALTGPVNLRFSNPRNAISVSS